MKKLSREELESQLRKIKEKTLSAKINKLHYKMAKKLDSAQFAKLDVNNVNKNAYEWGKYIAYKEIVDELFKLS